VFLLRFFLHLFNGAFSGRKAALPAAQVQTSMPVQYSVVNVLMQLVQPSVRFPLRCAGALRQQSTLYKPGRALRQAQGALSELKSVLLQKRHSFLTPEFPSV
jgi:hypothetical protein